MHMIAECAMLYVQASKAAASGISASALAPMLRTMENISILLDHLGPRGRESYLSKCGLYIHQKRDHPLTVFSTVPSVDAY